jgi:hypothetical protein
MAENTRVRLEPDIESYLKSQAERVLGKEGGKLTGAELTTLTNRVIYEHKVAQSMARQVPFAKLFNWLMGLVPGSGSGNKVVAMQTSNDTSALQASKPETLDFEADFASQFELDMEDAA